jgi:hypothetical protein
LLLILEIRNTKKTGRRMVLYGVLGIQAFWTGRGVWSVDLKGFFLMDISYFLCGGMGFL